MAVSAARVVGHHHVRTQFGDEIGELGDGGGAGVDERGSPPRGRTRHARVTPPAGTTEEARLACAEAIQRRRQLPDAVSPELVGVVDRQLCPAVTDDLALLTEGARQYRHLGTGRRVPGDGHTVVDRLVVGVRMDE